MIDPWANSNNDESLRRMNWDDVVQFPIRELPEVMVSPLKPRHSEQEEEPSEHVTLSVVPPEPSFVTRTMRHSSRVQAMHVRSSNLSRGS
jgi:hypothetical protein